MAEVLLHCEMCFSFMKHKLPTTLELFYVLEVVCFLLCNSPASGFYMPTLQDTLFHLHGQVCMMYYFIPTCL